MNERKINKLVGLGILSPVFIIVFYYIWPYIVGFLAIVGAVQVYRVWRNHFGRDG